MIIPPGWRGSLPAAGREQPWPAPTPSSQAELAAASVDARGEALAPAHRAELRPPLLRPLAAAARLPILSVPALCPCAALSQPPICACQCGSLFTSAVRVLRLMHRNRADRVIMTRLQAVPSAARWRARRGAQPGGDWGAQPGGDCGKRAAQASTLSSRTSAAASCHRSCMTSSVRGSAPRLTSRPPRTILSAPSSTAASSRSRFALPFGQY